MLGSMYKNNLNDWISYLTLKTSHHATVWNILEHIFVFKIVTSLAGCLLKTFVGRIRSFYCGSIIDNFEFPLALNIFSMAMCSELLISIYPDC